MALFGKKKDSDFTVQSMGLNGNLKDQITQLQQQGYPNDQIISYLQSQGHTMDEIQASMEAMNPMPNGGPIMSQDDSSGFNQSPQMSMPQPQENTSQADREKIEELAESIIDEKWKDIVQDINKVIEWKEKLESRLNRMEQQLEDLGHKFDSLHQGVLGKISDYDKNLSNVGVEIKAMQKVFQNVLPTFTDNVNKLDRLTKSIKKK